MQTGTLEEDWIIRKKNCGEIKKGRKIMT